jgi:uncharacterized cupredoxin-like copper-binding protein
MGTAGVAMDKALVAGGLLFALGAAPARAADVDWSHAREVTETTTEYKFAPSHLNFRAGAAYRLHIVNRGKETHEFHAPEFFAAMTVRDTAPLNADRTEIVIQPGQDKDLYFIASKPGKYPLICSDHDWAGMTGEIIVK